MQHKKSKQRETLSEPRMALQIALPSLVSGCILLGVLPVQAQVQDKNPDSIIVEIPVLSMDDAYGENTRSAFAQDTMNLDNLSQPKSHAPTLKHSSAASSQASARDSSSVTAKDPSQKVSQNTSNYADHDASYNAANEFLIDPELLIRQTAQYERELRAAILRKRQQQAAWIQRQQQKAALSQRQRWAQSQMDASQSWPAQQPHQPQPTQRSVYGQQPQSVYAQPSQQVLQSQYAARAQSPRARMQPAKSQQQLLIVPDLAQNPIANDSNSIAIIDPLSSNLFTGFDETSHAESLRAIQEAQARKKALLAQGKDSAAVSLPVNKLGAQDSILEQAHAQSSNHQQEAILSYDTDQFSKASRAEQQGLKAQALAQTQSAPQYAQPFYDPTLATEAESVNSRYYNLGQSNLVLQARAQAQAQAQAKLQEQLQIQMRSRSVFNSPLNFWGQGIAKPSIYSSQDSVPHANGVAFGKQLAKAQSQAQQAQAQSQALYTQSQDAQMLAWNSLDYHFKRHNSAPMKLSSTELEVLGVNGPISGIASGSGLVGQSGNLESAVLAASRGIYNGNYRKSESHLPATNPDANHAYGTEVYERTSESTVALTAANTTKIITATATSTPNNQDASMIGSELTLLADNSLASSASSTTSATTAVSSSSVISTKDTLVATKQAAKLNTFAVNATLTSSNSVNSATNNTTSSTATEGASASALALSTGAVDSADTTNSLLSRTSTLSETGSASTLATTATADTGTTTTATTATTTTDTTTDTTNSTMLSTSSSDTLAAATDAEGTGTTAATSSSLASDGLVADGLVVDATLTASAESASGESGGSLTASIADSAASNSVLSNDLAATNGTQTEAEGTQTSTLAATTTTTTDTAGTSGELTQATTTESGTNTTETALNSNKIESNVSSTVVTSTDEPQSLNKPNAPEEVMSSALEKASRMGIYGGGAQAALIAGDSTVDVVYARMGIRCLPNTIQPYEAQSNQASAWANTSGVQVWVSPVYRHQDASALQVNNSSYGANINLYGLAVGADFKVQPAWRLGAALNVGAGDASGRGTGTGISNDFNYYSVALYGGYTFKQLTVVTDLSYTKVYNEFDATVDRARVSSEMDGSNLNLGITGQYVFDLTPNSSIAPHVGLRYTNITLSDYQLNGFSTDSITYDLNSLDFVSLPIGVTFAHKFQGADWYVQPALDLSMTFNMGSNSIKGDILWDTSRRHCISINSEVLDDWVYGATLGVIAGTKDFGFGFSVNYSAAEKLEEYGVNASVRWLF